MFGAGLAGDVAQAWPADAVVDDGVERQHDGVAGAQPGLDQHDDEVAGGRFEHGEVGFVLELGHHELGDEAGQCRGPFGEVVLVDLGVGGDVVEPVVAPVVVEEHAQADQGQAAGVGRQVGAGQPGDVAVDQVPVHDDGCRGSGLRAAR